LICSLFVLSDAYLNMIWTKQTIQLSIQNWHCTKLHMLSKEIWSSSRDIYWQDMDEANYKNVIRQS
jgi:hypothetical protein